MQCTLISLSKCFSAKLACTFWSHFLMWVDFFSYLISICLFLFQYLSLFVPQIFRLLYHINYFSGSLYIGRWSYIGRPLCHCVPIWAAYFILAALFQTNSDGFILTWSPSFPISMFTSLSFVAFPHETSLESIRRGKIAMPLCAWKCLYYTSLFYYTPKNSE